MKYKIILLTIPITLCFLFSSCNGKISNEKVQFNKPVRTVSKNVYLNDRNIGGINESDLRAMLEDDKQKTEIGAVNASIDGKTWGIIGEKTGKSLNVQKTIEAALMAKENDKVDYISEITQPSVTSKQLASYIKVISDYTTPLLNRGSSRVNNIEIAADRINYKILKPGEEFSFNKLVGKRTWEKGYEEAPIIVQTPDGPKYKDAHGGGICQVSTTIYNAAVKCNLKITERHMHSKDVGYVPRGQDASISYGTADLKFVNNKSNPVMLRLFLGKKSLTVKIIENTYKSS